MVAWDGTLLKKGSAPPREDALLWGRWQEQGSVLECRFRRKLIGTRKLVLSRRPRLAFWRSSWIRWHSHLVELLGAMQRAQEKPKIPANFSVAEAKFGTQGQETLLLAHKKTRPRKRWRKQVRFKAPRQPIAKPTATRMHLLHCNVDKDLPLERLMTEFSLM